MTAGPITTPETYRATVHFTAGTHQSDVLCHLMQDARDEGVPDAVVSTLHLRVQWAPGRADVVLTYDATSDR